MSLFVVLYSYVDDPESVAEIRPEHRAFLATLPNLVLSGPTDDNGALLILEAASAAVVEQQLDADPFRTRGVIVHRRIVGWNVVLGRAKDRLGGMIGGMTGSMNAGGLNWCRRVNRDIRSG